MVNKFTTQDHDTTERNKRRIDTRRADLGRETELCHPLDAGLVVMFDSREDALAFRDQLVAELDRIETDGWHVSPRLEGATLRLAAGTARVRGHLDGRGYRIEDRTDDETDADGWDAELVVRGGSS